MTAVSDMRRATAGHGLSGGLRTASRDDMSIVRPSFYKSVKADDER